jgi:hypothetical protein
LVGRKKLKLLPINITLNPNKTDDIKQNKMLKTLFNPLKLNHINSKPNKMTMLANRLILKFR